MGFYQAEKLREKWIEEGFLLTGDVPTINLKRKDDFKSLLINEAKGQSVKSLRSFFFALAK